MLARKNNNKRSKTAGIALTVLALTTAAWLAGAGADAQEISVDLELVLAADVSASIDPQEAALQRKGYVIALTDLEVIEAIRSGVLGRIAVAYVEWAGTQRTVVDWTIIEDVASAQAFTFLLQNAPLVSGANTSISGALDYAAGLFANNGFAGTRRVIDISGDGRNHSGRPLGFARDDVVADGITINALPMLRFDSEGRELNPGLDKYYDERVIGGPGAFMVPALGLDAFPAAIRRKLIIEISGIETPVPNDENPRAIAAFDKTVN